jgi:TRAP-type transport system periplasmic protein
MTMLRKFATCAISAAFAASLVSAAQAQTTELKVSHFLPPNHAFHKAMQAWGEELDKASGGKLKLQIYPAGQLGGGANRQLDAARNGISDIAISLHGATPGRYALTELVSLPYTSPAGTTLSAVSSRRLTELAPEYLAKEHEGLKILYMAVTPPLLVHSKVPIRSVADFKGVKIRYAGANFKGVIDAVGGVPLPVPPPETQDALSKGIVDAATFPYEGALSFRLGTVVKYSIEPAIASATFAVAMNPAAYDALPADLKALIDKTTGPDAAERFGKLWDQGEVHAKKQMQSEGVEVLTMPADEVKKLKAAIAPTIDQSIAALEKKGVSARKFYEAYTR